MAPQLLPHDRGPRLLLAALPFVVMLLLALWGLLS